MLKVLLEHGADPNARHPIIHKTCLHVAAKRGYHLCARILLAAGADSEAKDFRGNSALMYALKFGHPSVAKVILQGSAKLNTSFENYVNNKGETLLHVAIEGGDMECVKLAVIATPTCMRENVDGNGRTPLFVACKLNRPSLAELLIDSTEHFYNIDAQDKETGKTALHYAVENKNILLVEHLLRLGANPNARNDNWETPFLSAVKQGLDADMLLLFVNFQCDVMASDRYFNTALHYAASEGISHLISFLAELGLNPNCKGDCGLSPLMIAAFRNYLECAEELLKCGADPDLLDRNSATALVYSILGSSNRSPDSKNNAEVSNVNQLETIKLLLRLSWENINSKKRFV
ncbi:hypothetical protein HELRODRAFT_105842 [Helobdella robusta]|uniref:Uncharacterized protein n=1 Tax=Helobdella robusta TaxID=6412 RepID=T1EDX9_HELRO|nr:hypothetical protein HELRODRAFT_105842 [Helobdella robusta]ESO05835.1 hypothetical protein HELRODRAFT_105842 [Helobdella robusta]